MRRPVRPLVASALLALGPGCHSYLLPFDARPVIAPQPAETQGGERLDIDERGELVVRPPAGDVAAALGVGLHEREGALIVTHRLRADAPLEAGDEVVHVAAAGVPDGAPVTSAFADANREEASDGERAVLPGLGRELTERQPAAAGVASRGGLDAFDPTLVPVEAARADVPSAAELRARPDGHAVSGLRDLRGYLAGVGWLELDLLVERRGEEVVVRAPLRRERSRLPVRLWEPARHRWHGVDVVRVGDLSPDRRPVTAEREDDLLVVRVARDAPAARAGLRPLDVVPARAAGALLDGDGLTAVAPDGAPKRLEFAPRERATELWVPFLFTWQSDGVRTHVGAGPWDIHGHYSSRLEYVPTTDSYREVFRWSFGTSIQGAGTRTASGTTSHFGINLLDGVRLEYLMEWLDARHEAADRTGRAP